MTNPKYRCSCCDKMKPRDDGKYIPWSLHGDTDVMVCSKCIAALKQLNVYPENLKCLHKS